MGEKNGVFGRGKLDSRKVQGLIINAQGVILHIYELRFKEIVCVYEEIAT